MTERDLRSLGERLFCFDADVDPRSVLDRIVPSEPLFERVALPSCVSSAIKRMCKHARKKSQRQPNRGRPYS